MTDLHDDKSPGRPLIDLDPDWLALAGEPVLEPDLPIVDAHHHLWELPGSHYPAEELLADLDAGHRIAATVFVECRAWYRPDGPPELRSLGETEFIRDVGTEAAARGRHGICAGIVGNVDLRLGDRARPVLEAHVAAADGRFRGIRNGAAWHKDVRGTTAAPPPGLMMDPAFRTGFAALAPLGLSFDVWALHTQLDEVADLVRAFPDTAIVLDHVGGPIGVGPFAGRRDEVFAEWRARILELAQFPNLTVKLGGLCMRIVGFAFHERPAPPDSATLAAAWKPYVETCIAAFGPERCMFESNFPVDKGMCTYRSLWNAFKRLTAGCSENEKKSLFSGTAGRVYRLQTEN